MTFGILAYFNIGPWRCVDCGHRQMFIERRESARREISDRAEVDIGPSPVGNFLRTQQSLAHSRSDASRFSEKYRAGIVQKLLNSHTTVSRVCSDLGVSELEIQHWIKAWCESEIRRVQSADHSLSAGLMTTSEDNQQDEPGESAPWMDDSVSGPVIDSEVVRKPK
jgi:transposase-like protein